ncbi:MAG: hypothetical protein CMO80_19980 [Verrucomicrobiales bacterium]|nr:hypothetical protein [Verrucomicrobiales bacterium]
MGSDDFRTYTANLKRIGMPDQTIRDLLRVEISSAGSEKMQAAMKSFSPTRREYWKPYGRPADYQDQMKECKCLGKEQEAMLKELVGDPNPETDPMEKYKNLYSNSQYEYVPEDKRKDFKQLIEQLRQETQTSIQEFLGGRAYENARAPTG